MKVLTVVNTNPRLAFSGGVKAGRQLAFAIADLVDVDLAVMSDADQILSDGPLTEYRLQCTNPLDRLGRLVPRQVLVPLYGSAVPRLIEDGGYDLVHMHNLIPQHAALRTLAACRRHGVPIVISSHGFFEMDNYTDMMGHRRARAALNRLIVEAPLRRIVAAADAVLALSDCDRPMLERLGVPDERIHVVTNGVDEYYLDEPTAAELAAVRAKFGIGDHPVLLFAGSIHRYKGLDVFLQCLEHVHGDVHAVIAGRFRNEADRAALVRHVDLSGDVRARVCFAGEVTDEELRSLYHLASLFVYPTRGDTLPLVVLEAMACGLVPVTSAVGGLPCMVTPEVGVLLRSIDPASLARAIDELLANPQRRQDLAAGARAKIRREFRWPVAASEAVDVYRRVLGSASAG